MTSNGIFLLVVLSVVHAALSDQLDLCRNEQLVDKQRLNYGLVLLRQQIAEMLTLNYIGALTANMGWRYPDTGRQVGLSGFGAEWAVGIPPQYTGGAGYGPGGYGPGGYGPGVSGSGGYGSVAYGSGAYGSGTYGSGAYGSGGYGAGGLGSGGGNVRRQKVQTFKKEVPLKSVS
ncbi:unnamed protein product [Ixodes hexagonus]